MKSASAVLARPPSRAICWRSVWSVAIAGLAFFIGENRDVVVPDGVRGPKADDTVGGKPFLFRDPAQHRLRILVKRGRRVPVAAVRENAGEGAFHFPSRKEGRPIDVRDEGGEIVIAQAPGCR